MSDNVKEVVRRARKVSEDVDESAHEQMDKLNTRMHEEGTRIDSFIHDEPYKAMAIGVLAGVGIGALLWSLMCRRRD